jgi:hypothetical protein
LNESKEAYSVYQTWQEGNQREEESAEPLNWKTLAGREDVEVAFRVRDRVLEMKVKLWVRSSLDKIVAAITDCGARKLWDERVEDIWIVRKEGKSVLTHFEFRFGTEKITTELFCKVVSQGDSSRVIYEHSGEDGSLVTQSEYIITPASLNHRRHCASTGDVSDLAETYCIDYHIIHTGTATRLLLTDLLGSQMHFRLTWDNLKEFLELGYSSRRASEVLPPRTTVHRSVGGSQDVLKQLVFLL